MKADGGRLQATLGRPALARLVTRLEKRLAQGKPLSGTLTFQILDDDERDALARLLGRNPGLGRSVSINLDTLSRMLADASIAADLSTAVETLRGDVRGERDIRENQRVEWEQVHAAAEIRLRAFPDLAEWAGGLRGTGVLKRVSRGDASVARELVELLCEILQRLPGPSGAALPLAELAATATGDSHALDRGSPLSTLCLSLGTALFRDLGDDPAGMRADRGLAERRREIWARLGVLCDELSSPVLVLNLKAETASPTGRMLTEMAQAGEPARLSVRQLLREPPHFSRSTSGARVYITENPSVVAAAADRLGSGSSPLICTEGQPKTALHLVLTHLREVGVELFYHGDFDWKGLEIANLIIRRHGAKPWRMGCHDYLERPGRHALKGIPVDCAWDPALSEAMRSRGTVLHEEEVLDLLLNDLA